MVSDNPYGATSDEMALLRDLTGGAPLRPIDTAILLADLRAGIRHDILRERASEYVAREVAVAADIARLDEEAALWPAVHKEWTAIVKEFCALATAKIKALALDLGEQPDKMASAGGRADAIFASCDEKRRVVLRAVDTEIGLPAGPYLEEHGCRDSTAQQYSAYASIMRRMCHPTWRHAILADEDRAHRLRVVEGAYRLRLALDALAGAPWGPDMLRQAQAAERAAEVGLQLAHRLQATAVLVAQWDPRAPQSGLALGEGVEGEVRQKAIQGLEPHLAAMSYLDARRDHVMGQDRPAGVVTVQDMAGAVAAFATARRGLP